MNISNKPKGSLVKFIKSKSTKLRVLLLLFISVTLYGTIPYFTGSGLPAPEAIAPYANGVFPTEANLESSNPYRVAYPNLTFFYPIAFKPVPNETKVILSQLDGKIFWFENDETTQTKTLLMDFSPNVGLISDGGFFGFAIHPDFNIGVGEKNYIYVYYPTKNALGENSPEFGMSTGQGCDFSENEHEGNFLMLERFEVDTATMTAVPNSTTILLKQRLYGTTHYGGGMDFGDDGFLYLTTGDQASWQRSQDIAGNLDGGILRMDVDKDPTKSHPPARTKPADVGFSDEITGQEYWIPNDNPFSDSTPGSTTNLYGQLNLTTSNPNDVYAPGDFFEEYYSIGLRNPFRMTKDKLTGTFYLGDVGFLTHEEVNIVKRGANYGWPLYEGFITGPGCYTQLFNGMTHEEPLVSFPPGVANSITGGYVYRGSDRPDLYGKYICADYGGGDEIFAVDVVTGQYEEIANFQPKDIISFGEDTDGELFILNLGFNTNIYKLRDGLENYIVLPQLLSDTGVFSNLQTLEVIDGIVPYELYESFWSDGALKKRWIAVPNTDAVHSGTNEQINYSDFEDWEFPPGTVIIKHFDLQVDDNDPSITKKIETRFSVVGQDGDMYFLTYNWNEAQTDAVLQPLPLDEAVDIATTTGGTRTQTWHFPSNSECLQCHNDVNNGALGLKTRYLNTDYTYAETGITANQLVTLSHLGILNETITDSDTENIITNKAIDDPTATIDEKARSYLDLNCAYCHRFDSGNRAKFDLRYYNSTEATNLLDASIRSNLNIDPDEEIVYAGDASKSILFHRMNSVNPNIMMPPISKSVIDQPAVDLIEDWINQLDGLPQTNIPSPYTNIALLPSAVLSGSVIPGTGRGALINILYDPLKATYRKISGKANYGFAYEQNLGTVDADNGLIWRVDWPVPQFINYFTVGGAFPIDPQPNTMWRISYLRDGSWITIDEGTGGWVDDGIFQWDGRNEVPKLAEALRVQLYSDGVNDLIGAQIRGRGGITYDLANTDQSTQPKASVLQFLPYNFPTTIDTIVTSTQTACDPMDTTYTQELIVTYTNVPDTGSLIVNGQTFPITGSPQTITLTGLAADGLDVDVVAEFTDGFNTVYKSNGALFTAPNNCTNIVVGIDETMVINSDHVLPLNGSIEILEGGSLTINGNLTSNDQVILNSVSDKYSSLIVTGTVTGNITYKRHVNAFNGATGNDLVSSPLFGETFGDFASANPNLYENPNNANQKLYGPFEESSGSYLTYSTSVNTSTTLDIGVGYRAARDASEDGVSGTTLIFNGEMVTSNVSLPISESVTALSGWNLIGNPYPSYIDFDAFFNLNKTELDVSSYQAIYGYDGNATDGWTILNNVTTGLLIAPGQGFFVKAKSGGGTITFTPAMRVAGSSDDFILGRTNSPHFGHIKLNASTNSSNYNTDFYFNSNATNGLDPGYDAGIYGGNSPSLSIYSYLVEDNLGTEFSIQALNDNAMENVTIPLGINASQGQDITISILETDLPDDINVYLEDASNNTFTLLNTSDYVFTANSNISGIGRFFLRIQNTTLGTIEPILDSLNISTNKKDKTIVIEGQLQSETIANLFDINGRIMLSKKLNTISSKQTIDVSDLSAGIYIVELKSNTSDKRIQKLIIQ